MLTTGTSACSASSASVASEPVRSPIAATLRDSTSAVSRTDSPRASCSSPGRTTIGWPPSSTMPASNDVRVRVDGCSNTSATLRPSSARERERRGLQRQRAVEQRGELAGGQLGTGEEVARQARKCTSASFAPILVLSWNLFHGRAEPAAGRPLAAEFAATLAGWAWDVALLQEVPPWWPERLGAATGASARMALTSRNSLLPLRRAIASRKPDLLARQRRRLQRDPRARRRDRRAPRRAS